MATKAIVGQIVQRRQERYRRRASEAKQSGSEIIAVNAKPIISDTTKSPLGTRPLGGAQKRNSARMAALARMGTDHNFHSEPIDAKVAGSDGMAFDATS